MSADRPGHEGTVSGRDVPEFPTETLTLDDGHTAYLSVEDVRRLELPAATPLLAQSTTPVGTPKNPEGTPPGTPVGTPKTEGTPPGTPVGTPKTQGTPPGTPVGTPKAPGTPPPGGTPKPGR
jgi:hypothetical protein